MKQENIDGAEGINFYLFKEILQIVIDILHIFPSKLMHSKIF
jgi:hypothetical protein